MHRKALRYHQYSMSVGSQASGMAETVPPLPPFDDARLRDIGARVLKGERLSFDDGLVLYSSPDILGVGWMANYVREKMHGNTAYFNVNRHINPTNVCVAACRSNRIRQPSNAPDSPRQIPR